MEESSLGEWLQSQIEFLTRHGFKGNALKAELQRKVWLEKHQYLASQIGAARTMEEAWRACAECLEKELDLLTEAMPEIGTFMSEIKPSQT